MATRTKTKKGKKSSAPLSEPQIIESKGGLTASQFIREINTTLDEPLTLAQLRDLKATVEMVVTEQLQAGEPVNLFGLVKIVPRLHTAGERMVNSEFGNPESPKVKKKYPAKVTFKATQGIFTSAVKQSIPSVRALTKKIETQPKPKRRKAKK